MVVYWAAIGAAVAACLPALVMRIFDLRPDPIIDAVAFGGAVTAAAFILGWAAETAELDVSQGLALAAVAFIAVLPEYTVSFVLSWRAGADPAEAARGLAVANITGGNRLLIGLGWPLVFVLFYYRTRLKELAVDRQRALEIAFLSVASLYAVLIPLRSTLTLADSIVLVSLFVCYLFFTAKVESEEVELVGPAAAMGELSNAPRRSLVTLLLVYSAAVIFLCAEPFAESLIEIGQRFGVSEFLLIQWIAPIASESPEMLIAGLLAWRGRASLGMGALISSKVNQWTLLVGTLPVAFALSSGEFHFLHGLPLDSREKEELFLTAAQSLFAIAVFANLKMGRKEASILFLLFATKLVITDEAVRIVYAVAYMILCAVVLIASRRDVAQTARIASRIIRGHPDIENTPKEPRA